MKRNINVKTVSVFRDRKAGGNGVEFTYKFKRYVIVDADTGEVIDDAQGFGYRTREAAMAAYRNRMQMYRRNKSRDRE